MSSRIRRGVLASALVVGLTAGVGGTAAAIPDPDAPSSAEEGVARADDGVINSPDSARHGQHGTSEGHLLASRSNVALVGKQAVDDQAPGRVGDVEVFGNYAYLAAYSEPECERGGVYVFDISDLRDPRQIGFIDSPEGNYAGEGVQVVRMRTSAFTGNVLIHNNEVCDSEAEDTVGGATLVDVTDPRAPEVLSRGFGDRRPDLSGGRRQAHASHSSFIWTTGGKAYAVLVDNQESRDIDVFDVSDPRRPVKIAEYDLARMFPQILQEGLDEVFLHDMVVTAIGGRQVMLASYWDAGYVKLDVTDPRRPVYLGDTDFASPDPELLAQSGREEAPEGNGHEAEFTKDRHYVIGADEDFAPNGLEGTTDDGDSFAAVPGSDTPQLQEDETLSGTAVFVGRACPGDPAVPAPPATGGPYIAVAERGVCLFTEKVAAVEAITANGGYIATVIINREGSDGCGLFGMSVAGARPAFSVDRETGFGFFDTEFSLADCLAGDGTALAPIELGAVGDVVNLRAFFDGWGYVHLFKNERGKMTELDTYAIPEAMDPRYAQRFGDLSVHEVATSKARADLAYFSYYAAGFRVTKIVNDKLREVGHFIDRGGNNFWGVEVFERDGQEYVAASDRDFGLYILRYTGSP